MNENFHSIKRYTASSMPTAYFVTWSMSLHQHQRCIRIFTTRLAWTWQMKTLPTNVLALRFNSNGCGRSAFVMSIVTGNGVNLRCWRGKKNNSDVNKEQ